MRYGEGVTPDDVHTDSALILRFHNEIAYLDRMRPPENEARHDAELLGSKDGVLIVAWLWPTMSYEAAFDPFDVALRENRALWESAAKHDQPAGAENALEAMSRAIDHQRQERLRPVAHRFRDIIGLTALAVGRSVDDVTTHLAWSVPVARREMSRLSWGHTPFPFSVIVGLCGALQLEFTTAWALVDPQRLARRIDESILASGISDHLRALTLDNLESVARRLPRGSASAGQSHEVDVYRAPGSGARYGSLYEALAADLRKSPDYGLAEVDRLLVDAGEMPLPESARSDRSWWAGNGTRAEGRPQVSAWWAAGYRIRNIETTSSGKIASVGFEALPGRAQWLAKPARTAEREYRAPDPERIEIYKAEYDLRVAMLQPKDVETLKTILTAFGNAVSGASRNVPNDPDIRELVEFLERQGEADRSQIEHHFSQIRDAQIDVSWMTNLLSRARRQGWTVNNGTRRRPRWALGRLTAEMMSDIADNLRLETSAIKNGDAVTPEFLQLVAKAVGVDSTSSTGPQIARRIIEFSGGTWQPEFESADMSVTGSGLKAVRDSVGTTMPPDDEIITFE